MSNRDDDDDSPGAFERFGIYTTLPFILAVPPIVGFLIGQWLDKMLDTKPYLMYTCLIFGFIAAIREFYRVITNLKL